VDLHRVGHPPLQAASEDHRAHDQVVGERHLRSHALAQLEHGGHVGCDVVGDLPVIALRERTRLDALVAVRHVHGQQLTDVRPIHGAPARPARAITLACGSLEIADSKRAVIPVADRIHERIPLGVTVLAEQMHLVSETDERSRQARVVDVRPGPVEQIAVEDQHAHSGRSLSTGSLPHPLR
jgi:hypothetical protein